MQVQSNHFLGVYDHEMCKWTERIVYVHAILTLINEWIMVVTIFIKANS